MSESTKAYNPRDHLVKLKTRTGEVDYYPAAWRLYELNLRYPTANFHSQLLHLDVERNFVIVKCTLYLGRGDLDMAERQTQALKQGMLSALDKVETAAKARCARDLGISTELALDLDEDAQDLGTPPATVPPANTTPAQPLESSSSNGHLHPALKARLNQCFSRAKSLGLCETTADFLSYVAQFACGLPAGSTPALGTLTPAHLVTLEDRLHRCEQQTTSARTPEAVKAFFAKTYRVQAEDLDTEWPSFLTSVLGHRVPDDQLTTEHLIKLNFIISQEYQRLHTPTITARAPSGLKG